MIQKTEQEIMRNWTNDRGTPLVSICTITYNHEKYIEKSLDSFLMQETNFSYEIVISDDCSTDNNAKIIQNYIDKYPNIFNANLRTVNVGMGINGRENLTSARGEYIALCEGDDYWTDKNKLQIQVDILEKNTEVDMCFHKALKIDMRNKKELEIGAYSNDDSVISIEDIILKTNGQIPTASTMFRTNILQDIIDFRDKRPWLVVGDIYMHFFGSKRGGSYFINKTMSIYRHYSEGSWTAAHKDNYKNKIMHTNIRIKSYEELDALENSHFTLAFKQANKKRILTIIMSKDIPYIQKIFFTLKHGKYFSFSEKTGYYGLVLIPYSSYLPKGIYKSLKKLLHIPSK